MRNLSTILIVAVGALVSLSLTMLASATMLDGGSILALRNQAAACAIGFAALMTVAFLDYRKLGRWVWWIYGITLVLLALVLTPFGHETKGAQRWLFGTQPSELAKLTLVLVLAWYGMQNRKRMDRVVPGLFGGFCLVAPMIALVLKEPDRGTAALMMGVTLLVLLVAGVRWWFVVPPALVGGTALAVMVMLSPMARGRFDAWIHPDEHKDGAAHQVRKGLFAFANGGVEGSGLGKGTLKYNVPEVHTDFILPAVGEELGLPFTLGVVLAYGLILICGLVVASRAPDQFGMLLAAGITFLLAAQACINLGVVTAVLPNKGMPLPFVSRGGSSIAVLLTMVGLLLSVARQAGPSTGEAKPARKRRSPFSPDADFAGAA